MALTDVALCSHALIRIGARPISSFADGTTEADVAGTLYGSIRDDLLSSYGWSFATGQEVLNQLAQNPEADYDFAYQLPNDFLRALSAGHNGRGRGLDFRINKDTLQTDSSGVLLTYIFRPDESAFPPFFDAALIALLAAEFVIPITESTSRADVFMKLAEQSYARAKQVDAQQDTPSRLEQFSLIDARS